MARIRSLKPEAFQSETLGDVSLAAERTFLGLSTLADDRGRLPDKAPVINGALWPMRPGHTAADLEAELGELAAAEAICRYVGCDGKRYLHLVTWDEHQKIDRPSKSRLPRCPAHAADDRCGRHDEESCPSSSTHPREPSMNPREDARDVATDPGALDAGSRIVDLGPRTDTKETSSPSSSRAKRSTRREDEPQRVDVEQICRHLADWIEKNGSPRPEITKGWREAGRRLLDRDGKTVEQVMAAVDWCQNDEFWRANILSMPKLRSQYEQLRLQAARSRSPTNALAVRDQPKPSTTDQRVAQALALADQLDAQEGVLHDTG